jgi:ATP-dependent protease HslVU (ClpYQ) peptidase subunit
MTAIAAVRVGDVAAIAIDSQSTCLDRISVPTESKHLHRRDVLTMDDEPAGALVIGAAGMHSIGNSLDQWQPPRRAAASTTHRYMYVVASDIRRQLLERSVLFDRSDDMLEGDFLAVYDGRVFFIGCDFCVLEPSRGFHAIGSGGHVCLGALAALVDNMGGVSTRRAEREAAVHAVRHAIEREAAVHAVRHAIEITMQLVVSCGGEVTSDYVETFGV